jgi:hypothetical protein
MCGDVPPNVGLPCCIGSGPLQSQPCADDKAKQNAERQYLQENSSFYRAGMHALFTGEIIILKDAEYTEK